MSRAKRRRRFLLVLACYLLAAVVWLVAGAVRLAMDAARQDGVMAPQTLEPEDFTGMEGVWVSPEWTEGDRRMVSMDPDPRLLLELPGGLPVGRVVFDARALNKASGGMHLYYTTDPEQGFSERRKLWASEGLDGAWYFDLEGRRVYALRLDIDSAGGVIWQVEGITLNAGKPASAYFLPDAQGWFLLLFAPALVAAAIGEAAALISPWFARRKLERKWLGTGSGKAGPAGRGPGKAGK